MITAHFYNENENKEQSRSFNLSSDIAKWMIGNKGWTQVSESRRENETYNSGKWELDESAKYISEYNAVDEARRHLYSTMCDPLRREAEVKTEDGELVEASDLIAQARAARVKVQTENPWPVR